MRANIKELRSCLIGYKLRTIESESRFSQELVLDAISRVVPPDIIKTVLAEQDIQTQRERKLNMVVTVLLTIAMSPSAM